LAQSLGISLRTLYRDIATLQEQGARIEGEAGVGYLLRPGFVLPPLMLTEEEIEALVLGSRWVMHRGEKALGEAAESALSKIAAVLPAEGRHLLDSTNLLPGPVAEAPTSEIDLQQLRQAIRSERKLQIEYQSLKGSASSRVLWPFALGYFDQFRVLVAWCELRQAIRHFRTDCIRSLVMLDQRYPPRRQALLDAWREQDGQHAPEMTTDRN